jgi:hypothetical protein
MRELKGSRKSWIRPDKRLGKRRGSSEVSSLVAA